MRSLATILSWNGFVVRAGLRALAVLRGPAQSDTCARRRSCRRCACSCAHSNDRRRSGSIPWWPEPPPPGARCTSEAITPPASVSATTPSAITLSIFHAVRDQHLDAREREHRAERRLPGSGTSAPPLASRKYSERRLRDGEHVRREHDERVERDREDGRDRVDREHEVGSPDAEHRHEQRRRRQRAPPSRRSGRRGSPS